MNLCFDLFGWVWIWTWQYYGLWHHFERSNIFVQEKSAKVWKHYFALFQWAQTQPDTGEQKYRHVFTSLRAAQGRIQIYETQVKKITPRNLLVPIHTSVWEVKTLRADRWGNILWLFKQLLHTGDLPHMVEPATYGGTCHIYGGTCQRSCQLTDILWRYWYQPSVLIQIPIPGWWL